MSSTRVQPDDPVSLLAALIRCPSVTPEPAGVLDLLRDWLVGLGFAVELVAFEGDGSYRVENLFATRGETGPHLLFAGHTDVVPPGDAAAWTHPPFAAEAADGRLYGRGAADMKSGVAAFVAAAAAAIAAGAAETGRISLAITNDEEADGINGTQKLMAWATERGHRFDFAIVGEPSSAARVGDSIKIGRRGSLNAEITVTGVQGHVAYPEKARNPLPLLAEIVTELSGPLDGGSAAFPPSNLEFTSLDVGNPVANVIPGAARAASMSASTTAGRRNRLPPISGRGWPKSPARRRRSRSSAARRDPSSRRLAARSSSSPRPLPPKPAAGRSFRPAAAPRTPASSRPIARLPSSASSARPCTRSTNRLPSPT